MEESFDPGLTKTYGGKLRRIINKDGTFNVRHHGRTLSDMHLYQFLVSVSWPVFALILTGGYVAMNGVFALAYLALGVDHLHGALIIGSMERFLSAFFFSTQTFTTVGYGTIAPEGTWTNLLASFEALVGLLSLAIATGLLYGRFSRATARLVFSDSMVVAPYRETKALMFRVANRRASNMMEVEAQLLLMTVVSVNGQPTRRYDPLPLEIPSVHFLPLTWTVVHAIKPSSPLFGKSAEDLASLQAEVLVLLKGYDDAFRQTVHARTSYRYDEFAWNRRFAPAFHVDTQGGMIVNLGLIHTFEE